MAFTSEAKVSDCSVLAGWGGARNSRDESLHPRPPPPMGGCLRCAPRGIYISLSPTLQSLRLIAGGESQQQSICNVTRCIILLFICNAMYHDHPLVYLSHPPHSVSALSLFGFQTYTSTSRGKGAESDLGRDHKFSTFWTASSTFGGQNMTKSGTNKSISCPHIFEQCYPTSGFVIEVFFPQARAA